MVLSESAESVIILEPQFPCMIAMQESKESILIIKMMVPKPDLRHPGSIKKMVFTKLEDNHTFLKRIDLITLVAKGITFRRD